VELKPNIWNLWQSCKAKKIPSMQQPPALEAECTYNSAGSFFSARCYYYLDEQQMLTMQVW
jgi:hypothetical protein